MEDKNKILETTSKELNDARTKVTALMIVQVRRKGGREGGREGRREGKRIL